MWREMFEQSEGVLKENARIHIMALDATDAAERLSAQAARFRERIGRWPRNLGELSAAGLSPGPLVDPSGVPFEYDARTGEVAVSRLSYLRRDDLMGETR